jgi:dephospho-CoA kinase
MFKVAIVGQQCAGKTITAEKIMQRFYAPVMVKFADPIYNTLQILGQTKHRGFMTEFGDLAKKHFGDDIFVKIFDVRSQSLEVFGSKQGGVDLLICDDVRRYYEMELCQKLGYKILFVEADESIRRKRANGQGLTFVESHNSENEVPSLRQYADDIITNSSDLDALNWEVNRALVTAVCKQATASMH